ncbi:MAG: alpha/beta hydrolase family esterase [Sciscionella sp.]
MTQGPRPRGTTRRVRRFWLCELLALTTALVLVAGCSIGISGIPNSAHPHRQPRIPPAPASARCAGTHHAGLRTVSVHSAGRSYSVPVYFPRGYTNSRRVPLLLDLHGSAGNGLHQLKLSGFATLAAKHDFLVAAPDGGVREHAHFGVSRYSWNVPGVPLFGGHKVPAGARNDVRFLRDTINQIVAENCVDRGEVYVAGFSGGARMASALACDDASQVDAIIAVSGLRAGMPATNGRQPKPSTCRPGEPVSVLAFHGLADKVAPYRGGAGKDWRYSVPEALTSWARLDGCARRVVHRAVSRHVRLTSYPRCGSRPGGRSLVELFTISDGGHRWPGSDYTTAHASGHSTHEISGSTLVWQFLSNKDV